MAASNVLMLKKAEGKRQEAASQEAFKLEKEFDKRQDLALQEAFKRADVEGDGKLSVDEYYRILQEHSIKTTREEIANLLELNDKNHDERYITRAEFLGETTLENKAKNAEMVEKAERAFNIIDRNRDGYITKAEMLETTKKLTAKQIEAVFDRNDRDGDGKLSKEEFTEMMCREKRTVNTT